MGISRMAADRGGKSFTFHGIGLSAITTAFAHPLTYVKVLVQVGYDPLPPKRGKTIFGKDVLYLTGFFDYAKYIRSVDGFAGLYCGLGPRLIHNFVNSAVTNTVNSRFHIEEESENVEEDVEDAPVINKSPTEFLVETCQLSIGKAAGVFISYPFHLISVRTMVQFVGRETYYNNIFSSVREIYQEEGLSGFFSGVIPQLIGEMIAFWILRTVSYCAETYLGISEFSRTSSGKMYIQGLSQYIASLATFPFFLVTNMMAVNNTRLAIGNPPNIPIFENWTDCWVYLSKEKLLRRGDSIIRRTLPLSSKAMSTL